MIRTVIRRGGLLVATTALAGTAFAGSAAAATGYDITSYNHVENGMSAFNATGYGGLGTASSSVSRDVTIHSTLPY